MMTAMDQGAQPLRKLAVIEVGSARIEVDPKLAAAAGFTVFEDGATRNNQHYNYLRLCQALSEGHEGERAVLRAIAIGEEEQRARRASDEQVKVANLHAQAASDNLRAAVIAAKRSA